MGSLTLAKGGLVYVDTNVVIYSVERVEPYRTLLAPMWERAQAGDIEIVSSESIVIEALVRPLCERNAALVRFLLDMFDAEEVRLIPATRSHWEHGAEIRADTGLKAADALHAATALQAGCDLFITNDADVRRVAGLAVVILDDVIVE